MTRASEYQRKRERENPEWFAQEKLRRRRVKQERNRRIIQEARSKPCVDCGIQYPVDAMQLDHRDRATKYRDVARAVSECWGLEKLQAEIDKCDVRCANCHSIKTAKEQRERANRQRTLDPSSDHSD